MSADGIADLRALLQAHCDALGLVRDEQLVQAFEGRVPEAPDPRSRRGGEPPFDEDPTPTSAEDIVQGNAGPRWVPLAVGLPPGVKELVGLIKTPVQVLAVVLRILAAIVAILKVVLLGIMDPFAALVKAAIEALSAIITDLLGAGGYLYWDVPGITSTDVSLAELGLAPDLETAFTQTQAGEYGPTIDAMGLDRWLSRFRASFDDAGDEERPQLSDGATIEAVFIVGSTPTLERLVALAKTLGRLFSLDGLDQDWDRFFPDAPDQEQENFNHTRTAPDWEKFTLLDLFPQLEPLTNLPDRLAGLLLKVDGIVAMVEALAEGIERKIQLLLSIVEMIEDIIEALESLSSLGLYTLPISTQDGIDGLVEAARAAADPPPGDYVAGACALAAGPGLADFAMIGSILSGGAWQTAGEAAIAPFRNAEGGWEGSEVQEALQAIHDTADDELGPDAPIWDEAEAAWDAFTDVEQQWEDWQDMDDAFGRSMTDLGRAIEDTHADFGDDLTEKIDKQRKAIGTRGRRSLAGLYGGILLPERDDEAPEDGSDEEGDG